MLWKIAMLYISFSVKDTRFEDYNIIPAYKWKELLLVRESHIVSCRQGLYYISYM